MDGVDPYFLVKQEIEKSISKLHQDLAIREDMTQGGNRDIFRSIGIDMDTSINFIRSSLSDINETIQKCRMDPKWGLSHSELEQRDQFVRSIQLEIQEIERRMGSQTIQFPSSQYQPSKSSNSYQSASLQLQAHHEQKISQIQEAVRMQHQLANEISHDLDEDKLILNDIDSRMDNANDAMKAVTEQITQLIEQEGKTPTLLVFGLSLVLIFLLFLVV